MHNLGTGSRGAEGLTCIVAHEQVGNLQGDLVDCQLTASHTYALAA
jgi:hypothetical protein